METIKERERSPLSRFLPESLPLPSDTEDERTHVGEVVESSTTELIAQARELHGAPSFGQFIRVEADMPVVGIVFNVFYALHRAEPPAHGLRQDRRGIALGAAANFRVVAHGVPSPRHWLLGRR